MPANKHHSYQPNSNSWCIDPVEHDTIVLIKNPNDARQIITVPEGKSKKGRKLTPENSFNYPIITTKLNDPIPSQNIPGNINSAIRNNSFSTPLLMHGN